MLIDMYLLTGLLFALYGISVTARNIAVHSRNRCYLRFKRHTTAVECPLGVRKVGGSPPGRAIKSCFQHYGDITKGLFDKISKQKYCVFVLHTGCIKCLMVLSKKSSMLHVGFIYSTCNSSYILYSHYNFFKCS